jgi:Dolichyl-phosphate-mannose-protein mannosyltransferase
VRGAVFPCTIPPDSFPFMIRIRDLWDRDTRKHLALALLLGLLLRLFFVVYVPFADVDSDLYNELGHNVVKIHAYAYDSGNGMISTDVRVPGYPLFISVVYVFFGDSQRAVLVAQAVLDLGTCVLIAILAASLAPDRSRKRVAIAGLWLAATCPFVANYAADGMTEVLATCFSAGALLLFVWAQQSESDSDAPPRKWRPARLWFLAGVIVGLGSLVRPETPIILVAPAIVLLAQWYKPADWLRLARAGILIVLGVVVPLVPWAVRNWITLHEVQFLTGRYFNIGGSYIPVGFYAWTKTWTYSYADVDGVFNKMDIAPLEITDFPAYAFDSPDESARVAVLLEDQHNDSLSFSPGADAQFAELARERTTRRPLRTYFAVPFRRALTLWFTPRTELLPYVGNWWPPVEQWESDHVDFMVGIIFFALNYFYALLALAGAWMMRKRRGVALLVIFILARTIFIAYEHFTVEPRFVLQCVPAVLALAALTFARRRDPETTAS